MIDNYLINIKIYILWWNLKIFLEENNKYENNL